ncbi:hypothetical protein U1Q18_017593, partial [Sarracenia purpurea var. burkii]
RHSAVVPSLRASSPSSGIPPMPLPAVAAFSPQIINDSIVIHHQIRRDPTSDPSIRHFSPLFVAIHH